MLQRDKERSNSISTCPLQKMKNIENIVPVNAFKVSKNFRKTSEAFFLVEIVVQLHSLTWCVNLNQKLQLLEPWKTLRRAHPLLLYPIDTRFVRSIPSSREIGSCPHRTLLTFFRVPSPESPWGALPEATCSGRTALCGGTSPPHRLTTHPNTKTCSIKGLGNML